MAAASDNTTTTTTFTWTYTTTVTTLTTTTSTVTTANGAIKELRDAASRDAKIGAYFGFANDVQKFLVPKFKYNDVDKSDAFKTVDAGVDWVKFFLKIAAAIVKLVFMYQDIGDKMYVSVTNARINSIRDAAISALYVFEFFYQWKVARKASQEYDDRRNKSKNLDEFDKDLPRQLIDLCKNKKSAGAIEDCKKVEDLWASLGGSLPKEIREDKKKTDDPDSAVKKKKFNEWLDFWVALFSTSLSMTKHFMKFSTTRSGLCGSCLKTLPPVWEQTNTTALEESCVVECGPECWPWARGACNDFYSPPE